MHAATVQGRDMAEYTLSRSSTEVSVALFGDLEDAVSWLQHTRPEYVSNCALPPRQATHAAKLTKVMRTFEQEIEATKASPVGSAQPPH